MGEKFTTRKGRVRRNIVALLSAVALGVGGVAVPQTAGAWVQQDIERNYGEKPDPVQETKAIFETFKPETMQSDGSYTYTIGGKAKAPKPLPDQNDPDYELKQRGASDILTMTVWVWAATPNTVLEEPTADDFKWASGQTRPFKSIEKVRADDGVYTDQDGNKIGGGDGYKIEFDINAAEDSFTAEIQAKLKADIPAGALVTAATYVETTISPRVIWEHENSWLTTDPNDSDTCAGIAHGRHRLQGGGYGQWMAEMYLGSLNGNLELRGAPRVTFTLPNGDTFSGEESGMTQGDVSSQALDANYKAGFEKLNPNTVWGQKFDWPFDKNTATGKFWLPTGTIFEFEQNVYDKDKPCSDAKWGGDKLHHRAMLTSANPPIVTTDTAQTWFKMPEGEEPCDCELGSVGDKVWIDKNKDGIQDEDETQGVPGVKVVLKDASGKEVARTVTDEDGNWNINVKPGDYTVVYEPGNNVPSKPEQIERTVTIKPGEKRDDIDLGILPSGSVGDRVWNDVNGDGKQGEGEEGLENVVVLVSRDGEPTRSAVTDKDGNWKIEGLNPNAEYDIRFIQPDGWEVTGKVPGSDESGLVSKVTVKPNEYNDTYDLGLKKTDVTCDCEPEAPGTLGDRVWVDTNGNGKEDPDETEGVEGITVIVRDKDGNEVIRTVTDEDGNWKVDVEPGEYTVEYKTRDGYTPTDPSQVSRKVVVESGKEYLDVDLGVKPGEKTPPVTETVTETVPVPTPPVTETVTETVPVPTTKVEQPNGKTDNGAWERCVANAVASPLLYLVPIAVLGAVGGELARPYMGAINEQLAKVNADIQAAMRRDTPDRGHGGAGRDNDQFAEIRAQLDAANRQIQAIGNDPDIQRFGTIALGVLGLVAAGGVLYDWCSNEKGEAFTSIKGGSSEPMPITTAPVTTTPEK